MTFDRWIFGVAIVLPICVTCIPERCDKQQATTTQKQKYHTTIYNVQSMHLTARFPLGLGHEIWPLQVPSKVVVCGTQSMTCGGQIHGRTWFQRVQTFPILPSLFWTLHCFRCDQLSVAPWAAPTIVDLLERAQHPHVQEELRLTLREWTTLHGLISWRNETRQEQPQRRKAVQFGASNGSGMYATYDVIVAAPSQVRWELWVCGSLWKVKTCKSMDRVWVETAS